MGVLGTDLAGVLPGVISYSLSIATNKQRIHTHCNSCYITLTTNNYEKQTYHSTVNHVRMIRLPND